MTKINWKVRLKKKTFLVTIFSATLLFVQAIASAFGYDLMVFGDNLTEKFNALLTFLTAMGIVIDPKLKEFLIVNKQWIMIHRDKTPTLLLIEEGIFFVLHFLN